MDEFTGKTSFEQWFSQISSIFLEEQIEYYQLDLQRYPKLEFRQTK